MCLNHPRICNLTQGPWKDLESLSLNFRVGLSPNAGQPSHWWFPFGLPLPPKRIASKTTGLAVNTRSGGSLVAVGDFLRCVWHHKARRLRTFRVRVCQFSCLPRQSSICRTLRPFHDFEHCLGMAGFAGRLHAQIFGQAVDMVTGCLRYPQRSLTTGIYTF